MSNIQPLRMFFRLDLYEESKHLMPNKDPNDKENLQKWIMFIMHRRFLRIEEALIEAGQLSSKASSEVLLPDTEESFMSAFDRFLTIWKPEQLQDVELNLPEELIALGGEWLNFFKMIDIYPMSSFSDASKKDKASD